MSELARWARVAGALFLVSIFAGGFGEAIAPSLIIVSGDAAATAHNVVASSGLFRLGFAAYLVEGACNVVLAAVLYVLLRPVSQAFALIGAFMHMMGAATFAFAELFYFIPALLFGGDAYLRSFSADQLNTLVLLSMNVYGLGGGAFLLFYGLGSMSFGYLMMRSRYIPWMVGLLLLLGGAGFVVRTFVFVLAPAIPSTVLQLPAIVSILVLALWLTWRGLDSKYFAGSLSNSSLQPAEQK